MGTLSKLLLDQSTQFPSEPCWHLNLLQIYFICTLLKKIPSVTLFRYLLFLPLYFKDLSLYHFII